MKVVEGFWTQRGPGFKSVPSLLSVWAVTSCWFLILAWTTGPRGPDFYGVVDIYHGAVHVQGRNSTGGSQWLKGYVNSPLPAQPSFYALLVNK